MANIEVKKYRSRLSDVKSDVVSDHIGDVKETSLSTEVPYLHKVLIPQGIPFNDLYSPYVKNKRRGRDVNAHLISLFILKNQWKKKNINGIINLNSTVLRQICGGNYSKYINAMIDAGVISQFNQPYDETINGVRYVSKGTFSIKFNRSKQYHLNCKSDEVLEEYTIIDKQLIDKINKARVLKLERIIKNNPTAANVYRNLKKLSIDKLAATKSIREQYQYSNQLYFAKMFIKKHSASKLKSFIRDVLYTKRNKKKLNATLKRYGIAGNKAYLDSDVTYRDVVKTYVSNYTKLKTRMHWIGILDQIQNGNHSYISMSEDKRTKRLFHTLTMTPKNVRNHIQLDKKQLIELDASNCQWSILIKLCNILCKSHFYKDLLSKYGIITTEEQNQLQHDTNHVPLNMLHSFFDSYKDEVQKDLRKLEAYLEQDKLRPMVVAAYREKGKSITDGEAKGYLIKNVLFGNPNHNDYSNWTSVKVFKMEFPMLYQVLIKLKRYWLDESFWGYSRYGKKKESNRFKCLPLVLQRMESEVFIDGLKNLTAPFITIHDAVITNKEGLTDCYRALNTAAAKTNTNLKFKYKEL